jgi:hypothetical protein
MSFESVYPPHDSCVLKGKWKSELFDKNGALIDSKEGHNVVCTNGKEFLASFLQSASASPSTFTMNYVAIGSDSTSEAAAQTALGTELSRTTGVASYISGQIYQVTATFAAGSGTGAIYEYGLFSSSSGGTMLSRDTEAVINKGASDTLRVICQLTIS